MTVEPHEANETPEVPGKPHRGRHLLLAVVLSLVVGVVGVVCFDKFVLPSDGVANTSKLYDYVYTSGKSENLAFVLNNMSDDGYLCFGSSEWYVSKSLVSTCPQAVFGENVTGVDMTYIGEAYDQSLWETIAAGAYGSSVKNKKVMIVISPQWFFKNNGAENKFYTKFSYTLYRAFAQNPNISDETKEYVRQRCSALGIDDSTLSAASQDTVLDSLNDLVLSVSDSWHLRSDIDHIVGIAPTKSSVRQQGTSTGEPDWNALLDTAEQEGEAACTNNDFGVYDAYWEKNHTYDPELFQNFSEADDEYDDLRCFLEVCHEVGLDPLVCILPVHGKWYDVSDVSTDERQAYYQRIRGICDDAGVAYADFSSCEYEKYFLCDTVHPGWKGLVRIEESFYDFINGQDDAFLGGAGFGSAEGLTSVDGG